MEYVHIPYERGVAEFAVSTDLVCRNADDLILNPAHSVVCALKAG